MITPRASFPAPFVCMRCLARRSRRRQYSSSSVADDARLSNAPQPPTAGAAKLTTRRVITLHGQDASKFLQGLITNDVSKDTQNGYYAAFLNAQGKILNDAFIYPIAGHNWKVVPEEVRGAQEDPGYLIDVDATTIDQLLRVLKHHKLRSKLKFRAIDEGQLDVWCVWKEGDRWTAHGQSSPGLGEQDVIALQDARAPGMGHRLLLPAAQADGALGQIAQAPLSAYTIRRYLRGVPEGEKEIPRTESLPMNFNMDLMGGIDFKKGCYSGQELTIRTHHTGVVRRRALPVVIHDLADTETPKLEYNVNSSAPGSELSGSDIKRDGGGKRAVGNLIGAVGNIGLGMCRVEQMTDLVVSGEGSSFSANDKFVIEDPSGTRYGVKPFVPDWIRGKIRAPKIQRRVD